MTAVFAFGSGRLPEFQQVNTRGTALAWARIDDKFSDHPKVLGCDLAAIGLWTLCLTWARGQASGGLIPSTLPRRFGDKGKATAQLVESGLWERSGDGWLIHNYSDYGPPRSHEDAAAAGRKGAAKRWLGDSYSYKEPLANDGSRAESALGPVPKPTTRTQPLADASGEKPSAKASGSPVALTPRSVPDHRETDSSTRLQGEIVHEPSVNELLGGYVDLWRESGVELGNTDKARTGKEIKAQAKDGKPGELISSALERLFRANKPPTALGYVIREIERERAGHPVQNGRAGEREAQRSSVVADWSSR